MAGGSNSFLRDVTRDLKVQKQVLPALQQLGGGMGSAPATARTVAPYNETQQRTITPETVAPPEQAALPLPNMPFKPVEPAPDVGMLNPPMAMGESLLDDASFYRMTGRRPSATEKRLLEARTRYMVARGRYPTPKELAFEAQRNLIAQRNEVVP